MSAAPLDDSLDSLDIVFTLPESIDDDKLRMMYEIIVARLRREASHCDLNTVQQLLIERIAYNYVVLRWHELKQTFSHTTAQKEFNSFWLSMTQEFNKQLRSTDSDFRKQLLGQVAEVIKDTLEAEAPETAKVVLPKLANAFAELGM